MKRILLKFLIGWLLAIVLLSGCGSGSKMMLSDFVFDQSELPPNCRFHPFERDDEMPPTLTSNPQITSNSEFTLWFARELIRIPHLAANVREALFSVYQTDGGEVGIFGLVFHSQTMADRAVTIMENRYTSQGANRFVVYQKDLIVIWLWREDKDPAAFAEFKKLIEKRIDPEH